MTQPKNIHEFEKLVHSKFNIYNSIFLNLPYSKGSNIGVLIPILYQVCKEGLEAGKDPQVIIDSFVKDYAKIETEEGKIDFMFRVIQYVERQIVLYDSVEDAAFSNMVKLNNELTLKDYLQLMKNKKNSEGVIEKLSDFSARIVLTAHPTQFYPPSVLEIISNLRNLIASNDINEIDITLQQLGLTSLVNSKKPTPLDEAKNIIYYLRNVYYQAIGDMYSSIKENSGITDFDNPDIIKLGFWPGGDRDGNPFVTSSVTMDVADELRMNLMKCYYNELKELQKRLTFRGVEEILEKLSDSLYINMFDPAKFYSYDDILKPLLTARKLLISNFHELHLAELDMLIDRVKIFKTHFATLDIRQNHSIHEKLIKEILINEKIISESLDELSKDELIDILLHKKLKPLKDNFDDDIVNDTVRNISQLRNIQKKNGEEGCKRYIISNSEDIFSVLFVFALFRWTGYEDEEMKFDIVPLFETMAGMDNSENIMEELFNIPEYRSHIIRRNEKQTIMLGFSDGTKDGGYMKANWSIFKTKEILTSVCDRNNIKAIFFDGRGGPPARGGGKTHQFYASQGRKIANNEIQLTIQGQTITSKYGTTEQFTHNFEQLLTAGLSGEILGKQKKISKNSRKLLEALSEISFVKYNELKIHEKFIPYLENRSTLRYYDKAKIGSRPGKRGNKAKLELSDLRAISFVGSWSQLKQNVPGYFGTGTAIKKLIDQGKLEKLKVLFKEVPFFATLALNSMMSLFKTNFELTSYMKNDPEYGEFWQILYDEYVLSKEMLLLISGFDVLMEEEALSRESIKIREKIVLPLLMIQQYALQKVSLGSKDKALYEKIVTRSLYGNINASRNSA